MQLDKAQSEREGVQRDLQTLRLELKESQRQRARLEREVADLKKKSSGKKGARR